ncbi:SPOR domain-containing protein [Bermanella marisrubri]|uniref:SPOR domain-containing protein n=1 Tax=Bermanella marisrubri TaxID=207949 RepID=Q1N283_9GAMM|nr:SPOR domain-containing protein [Bermanella marisrubri]EAT12281.1 hypothetical protein RED65_15618 [Bermanella marisrubri]QIZ85371.1 SPOR domain-containing protein [Bermanella marisrubri]
MRWILISLVIINLAYLGFQFMQPEPIKHRQEVEVFSVKDAKPIRLLSEVNAKPKQRPTTARKPSDQLCWLAGPYKVELDAKHLYARMIALDVKAQVVPQAVVSKLEYWVHIEPLPNKKQALRRLKELQKRNVDSFIITEGELENGISLGLFSQQSSVDRILAQLKKKNIDAQVKELPRTRDRYWVKSPITEAVELTDELRERLADDVETEWTQILCNSALPQS